MSDQNLLNSTKILPLPKTNLELGQQIVSFADEGCRAIIIDFLQGVMVVHPTGAGTTPELTEESVSYLLKTQHLKVIDGEHSLADIENMISVSMPSCTHIVLSKKYQTTSINTSRKILWTNIVLPTIALLIHQKDPQSEWLIMSMYLKVTQTTEQR